MWIVNLKLQNKLRLSAKIKALMQYLSVFALILMIFTLSGCVNSGDNTDRIGGTDKCFDLDSDHKCDVCQAVLNLCIDIDGNHICDVCGAVNTKCPIDNQRDHKCDVCGIKFSICYDADNSHVCDYCGLPMIDCEDRNNDHICDFCNLELTKCNDSDKNHICDICQKRINKCTDIEPADHTCDWCEKTISACTDADRDHLCDVCLITLSECGDADRNHVCDVCGVILDSCTDTDTDYICDICQVKMPCISVSVPNDCLANGIEREEQYWLGDSFLVIFTYVGNDGRRATGWIVYDSRDVEIARIDANGQYIFDKPDSYYAVPILSEN